MTDDPAKPPRFPYIGALLCAACVAATVWTWMRYSYAWPTTTEDLKLGFMTLIDDTVVSRGRPPTLRRSAGQCQPYVAVRGKLVAWTPPAVNGKVNGLLGPGFVDVVLQADAAEPRLGVERTYVGRMYYNRELPMVLDTTASRFHPASVAGLVVGAMGVFVFSMALRHWVRERRKFLNDARVHNQGMDRTSDD